MADVWIHQSPISWVWRWLLQLPVTIGNTESILYHLISSEAQQKLTDFFSTPDIFDRWLKGDWERLSGSPALPSLNFEGGKYLSFGFWVFHTDFFSALCRFTWCELFHFPSDFGKTSHFLLKPDSTLSALLEELPQWGPLGGGMCPPLLMFPQREELPLHIQERNKWHKHFCHPPFFLLSAWKWK